MSVNPKPMYKRGGGKEWKSDDTWRNSGNPIEPKGGAFGIGIKYKKPSRHWTTVGKPLEAEDIRTKAIVGARSQSKAFTPVKCSSIWWCIGHGHWPSYRLRFALQPQALAPAKT